MGKHSADEIEPQSSCGKSLRRTAPEDIIVQGVREDIEEVSLHAVGSDTESLTPSKVRGLLNPFIGAVKMQVLDRGEE